VTDHSRGVGHLLVGLLAVGGDDVLAVLNVGGVNDGLALLARNLARVLLGDLLALPVLLVMALRSSRVALAWLSISLSISLRLSVSFTLSNTISTIAAISTANNLGVMTNYSGGAVDLLGCFLAVGGDDVLAFLNVSSVHNNIVFFMTLLTAGLFWSLTALPVLLVMALGS